MAKQDVLDAINATIVENNQKGITAQALNNVLTMMTENAGEGGSGDGALKILVPDPISMQMFFNYPTEFTQTLVDGVGTIIPSEYAELYDTLKPLYNNIFTHNAEVYNTLLEKAANKEGIMVLLDCSETMTTVYKALFGSEFPDPSLLTVDVSMSEPAMAQVMVASYSGEDLEKMVAVGLFEKSDAANSILGNVISFTLNSSGEITFAYSDMSLYVPINDSYTLSSTQLAVNAAIYSLASTTSGTGTSLWENLGPIKLVEYDINNPPLNATVISFDRSEHSITYLQDLTLKKAVLASDGSVTVTTLGTLTSA